MTVSRPSTKAHGNAAIVPKRSRKASGWVSNQNPFGQERVPKAVRIVQVINIRLSGELNTSEVFIPLILWSSNAVACTRISPEAIRTARKQTATRRFASYMMISKMGKYRVLHTASERLAANHRVPVVTDLSINTAYYFQVDFLNHSGY